MLTLKHLRTLRHVSILIAYAATSPRLTFKNFKFSYFFLKFSDFNEATTNSLMMIY